MYRRSSLGRRESSGSLIDSLLPIIEEYAGPHIRPGDMLFVPSLPPCHSTPHSGASITRRRNSCLHRPKTIAPEHLNAFVSSIELFPENIRRGHVIGPMTAKLCVLATGPRCLIPAFGRLAGCRFGRGWGPLLTFRRFALPQEYRGRHAVPGAGALFCKSSDPSLTFRPSKSRAVSAGSSSHSPSRRVSSFRGLSRSATTPTRNCLDFGWSSRLQKRVCWRGPAVMGRVPAPHRRWSAFFIPWRPPIRTGRSARSR